MKSPLSMGGTGASSKSPPSRGAWIEIRTWAALWPAHWSPPSRGAWIEIPGRSAHTFFVTGSPPSRGAWIEISSLTRVFLALKVAPLAGGVD